MFGVAVFDFVVDDDDDVHEDEDERDKTEGKTLDSPAESKIEYN